MREIDVTPNQHFENKKAKGYVNTFCFNFLFLKPAEQLHTERTWSY